MPTITPCLWFDTNKAHEAAEYYCSIFPESKIISVDRFENGGPDGDSPFDLATFEVCGQRVMALGAGPEFTFDEAFSFHVEVASQEEVDRYWDKLVADGGVETQCGWLRDKYGLAWQIVPKLLYELLASDDKERANSAMQAMLKMVKIDCAALQEAYDNAKVNA